jgi:hypothetical protein
MAKKDHLMTFSKICAVAAATLAGLCISARADPYDPRDSRNQAVSVSVNYSFTLSTDGGAASSENASERGRRQAYEIAGRECAILLATIAESCNLGSVSISSQPQRAMPSSKTA